MALILYLTSAPRFNIEGSEEYGTITRKDLELMDTYFNWYRKQNTSDDPNAQCTFEEWCGKSVDDLPHWDIVKYYRHCYDSKKIWHEMWGNMTCFSIFSQLGVFYKMNPIFNWFIKNVMDNSPDKEYHEVTQEQLEDLRDTLCKLRDSFTFVKYDDFYNMYVYDVNESIAKELLPIIEEPGYFFGPSEYDMFYAQQVDEAANTLNYLLETTDFSKNIVYFNATW